MTKQGVERTEKGINTSKISAKPGKEIPQIMVNERVTKSARDLSDIIANYPQLLNRPNIIRMTSMLEPLTLDDFPVLIGKMAELGDTPIGEVRFDPLAEIMLAAEFDHQFGGLNTSMSEWYENEGRAAGGGQQSEGRVLDCVVDLVKLVEENRKKAIRDEKPRRTKPYFILYENGDFKQSGHGLKIDIPDGEDPYKYARTFLKKNITPGDDGLLLEDVSPLKPGEYYTEF